MVTSAAQLLRSHGVDGTSFSRVLEHSAAPRGSVGHHFPGGKREMLVDAVRWAGDVATHVMRDSLERGDSPAELFGRFCAFHRRALVDSAYAAGCPIGAVAFEAYADPELRPAVEAVFADWRAVLREVLLAAGRPEPDAEALADVCIAAYEGALMLARVDRSTAPLDRVEAQLRPLLDSEREAFPCP
jgi:AcrR family transcriptional regulator